MLKSKKLAPRVRPVLRKPRQTGFYNATITRFEQGTPSGARIERLTLARGPYSVEGREWLFTINRYLGREVCSLEVCRCLEP